MGVFTGAIPQPAVGTPTSAGSFADQVALMYAAFNSVWTPYTPVMTGFTQGNGTWTNAAYLQVGKLVHYRLQFTFGTTSAAAAAVPTFTLPVTARFASLGQDHDGWFENTGVAKYRSNVYAASTTTISCAITGTSGLSQSLTTTTPFTWATGSNIYAWGSYEAA